MKKDLLVKLGIIGVIVLIAAWFAFFKNVDLVETLKAGRAVKNADSPVKLGLDLKGGVYVVLEAKPVDDKTKIDAQSMGRLVEVMDRRINALGVTEPTIQRNGENRIIIELPGLKDSQSAIDTIGKTALLEFKMKNDDGTLGPTLLTGKSLKRADVTFDSIGNPQIAFEMDAEGAKEFAKITRANIGKRLAITLDGEEQTAPTIQSEIPTGNGVITGEYNVDDAKKMALLLNAGALPLKVDILETRTIGPNLGEKSIKQSFNAGIGAVILIMLFMFAFYRLPGIVANVGLAIYGVILLGVLNFMDATLTLPGIAAFILSMGMAVDANVIIFARMKEEMKLGTSVFASVDAGFNKAFLAILDSNVTTLIITAVLFVLGTGPIKGFAITLAVGILASMFTALMVTKTLLKLFLIVTKIENPIFFGVRR